MSQMSESEFTELKDFQDSIAVGFNRRIKIPQKKMDFSPILHHPSGALEYKIFYVDPIFQNGKIKRAALCF